MRAWIKRLYVKHKWLTLAVGVYVALSALELTRLVLFDRPTTFDVGFFPWETIASPDTSGATMPFHWTSEAGSMLRPVDGAMVQLLLYASHPDPPVGGVPVVVSINGQRVDEITILRNGWRSLEYYLPPLLGPDLWPDVEPGWAARTRAEIAAAKGGWLANWQELNPWHRRPGPPSVWIEVAVGSTFVPSEYVDTNDNRTLGIGVTEPWWLATLPVEGIGFYSWEIDVDGTEFRWARRRASLPVEVAGSEMAFSIRSQAPGIEQQPVTVDIYLDTALRRTAVLTNTQWSPISIPVEPGDNRSGTLTVVVDRSWNPAALGFSVDDRELGVGMTRIEWR